MQFYETTIYNDELTASFSVLTIPGRSLSDADGFLAKTGLNTKAIERIAPLEAEDVLKLLLAVATETPFDQISDRGLYTQANRSGHRELIHFAEYIYHQSSIPFEQSPLKGISVGQILKSPMTIGASTAAVAVIMHQPILFVAVPAGIIICTAAKGVGDGVSDGLKHLIVKAMTGKAPGKKSGGKKAKKADDESDPSA